MLRIREAVHNPPFVLMEDAVTPLANRKVEAERVHEATMRTSAIGRRDGDLMWPSTINRGCGQFASPPTHGISRVLIGHTASPDVNASEHPKKSEAEIAALLEAEIDEAIASCGGDVRGALRATMIANAYLEAEIERLTEAISAGFLRGRMRRAPQRMKKM